MSNLEKEICKFWKRGLPCDFGEKCRFLHAELYKPKRNYMEKEHFGDKFESSDGNLRRHYTDSRGPPHDIPNHNRDALHIKGYKSPRTIGSAHRSPSMSGPDHEAGFKHMGKIQEPGFKHDENLPSSSVSNQKHVGRKMIPNIGTSRKRFRGESDFPNTHESREPEESKFSSAFAELLNHADFISHSIENDWKELQKKMKSNLIVLYDMENMIKDEAEELANQRMINENMLLNAIALEKENQAKLTQARLHEEKASEMKNECERLRDESEKISSEYSLQSAELQGKLNKLSEAQKNLAQREREIEEKIKRIEKREQELILKESRLRKVNSNLNSSDNFIQTNVQGNSSKDDKENDSKLKNTISHYEVENNGNNGGNMGKMNENNDNISVQGHLRQNIEKQPIYFGSSNVKKEELHPMKVDDYGKAGDSIQQYKEESLGSDKPQVFDKVNPKPEPVDGVSLEAGTSSNIPSNLKDNTSYADKSDDTDNFSTSKGFRDEILRNSKFSENGFESRKNENFGSGSRKPFFRKKILKTENYLKKKIYLEEKFSQDAPELLIEMNKYGLLNDLELYDDLFFEEEILGQDDEKESEKDENFYALRKLLNRVYGKENGKSTSDSKSNLSSHNGKMMSDSFGVLSNCIAKVEPKNYRVEVLAAIFQQCKNLQKNGWPFSWSWCSKIASFIFIFDRHNRIIVETPFYGHATYFFEIEDDMSLKWQLKRLIIVLSAHTVTRNDLLDNKSPRLDGSLSDEDLSILKHFGLLRGGIGSMLNYIDRIFHDYGKVNFGDEEFSIVIQNWIERVGNKLRDGLNMGRKTRNFASGH